MTLDQERKCEGRGYIKSPNVAGYTLCSLGLSRNGDTQGYPRGYIWNMKTQKCKLHLLGVQSHKTAK